jgi:hypothetical protein
MMNKFIFVLGALIAWSASSLAVQLKPGDPAPPVSIKSWLIGPPADLADRKNIYVLWLFSGRSGAAQNYLPLLGQIQALYKETNVVVLGVTDDTVRSNLVSLERIMTNASFRIAIDDAHATWRNYLPTNISRANLARNLSAAFVVGRDGRVWWHGDPGRGLKETLAAIVAGAFDLDAVIQAEQRRARARNYLEIARQSDPKASAVGRELLASLTNRPAELCGFAYDIATDLSNTNRDFALADLALDQALRAKGATTNLVLLNRGVVIFEKGRKTDGIAMVKQVLNAAHDPAEKNFGQNILHILESRNYIEKRNDHMPRGPEGSPTTTPPQP